MKWILILLAVFQSNIIVAQKEDDVSFLIRNIKGAYIGYPIKTTDKKFDRYTKKIERRYQGDTFRILSALADYFKDPHMKVYANKDIKVDSVLFSRQLKEVNAYMSDAAIRKKKYEGYWIDENKSTVIALQASDGKPWHYKSFIVQSNTLPLGFTNMKMEGRHDGNKYETDYTGLLGGGRAIFPVAFRNDAVFTAGYVSKWRKIKMYSGKSLIKEAPSIDEKASGRLLDSNNYLIRLPGNSEENVKIMDSLVKAEYKIIGSTKNLIIDIRDNHGGTVRAYKPLTPFVYTDPIIEIGGYKYFSEILCSANEQRLNDYKKTNPWDTGLIHLRERELQKCRMKVGKTLNDSGDTVRFESIKQYPENVGIITNYGCLSASEMMLYDYRQSKKVTVFGEHTYGAIDYLDDFTLNLPSKKYMVSIATAERKVLKGDQKRDYVGLYPDVPIPDSESDWVKFVQEYYNRE